METEGLETHDMAGVFTFLRMEITAQTMEKSAQLQPPVVNSTQYILS